VSAQARFTAQDYAQAVYDLALEAWTRQLGEVQRILKEDPALRVALADTRTAVSERLNMLDGALADGLSQKVRKFLGTLLEAGQLDRLGDILVELERLVYRRPERRLARVTSAVPLTEAEQEALRARLIDRFGTELDFQFEVDASLIGGVRLRVGDQIIDGSVAGRLNALRDRLVA
jgi:F-type H+-transporting ATPase subunit delta